ncbi:unnamed protein product [Natator depressus]
MDRRYRGKDVFPFACFLPRLHRVACIFLSLLSKKTWTKTNLLPPGALGQYTVTQDRSQAPAHEGEPIQLNCSYTGTEYSVHWYRQPQGGQPRFVASLSSSGRDTRENFTMSLDTKTKSSFLYLNSSRLEDAAVYLCALEHRAR